MIAAHTRLCMSAPVLTRSLESIFCTILRYGVQCNIRNRTKRYGANLPLFSFPIDWHSHNSVYYDDGVRALGQVSLEAGVV